MSSRTAKLLGCLLIGGVLTSAAQQRPIQSLYMFDPLLVNPAYAGSQVQLSATAIYRNQWVNLEGAPKTLTTSIHSGFKKSRVGLGVLISKDVIGIHDDTGLYGIYSYKLPISTRRKSVLSFGLSDAFLLSVRIVAPYLPLISVRSIH